MCKLMIEKYIVKIIKNSSGMVSVESLIVFPLIIMIIFTFISYMLLEFEKSNIILSSNQISLDVLNYKKEKPIDNNFIESNLSQTPFTRSIKIERNIKFTSEFVPEWASVSIEYNNKSTSYKKFNLLVLKEALFDGFLSESLGD